MTHDMILVDIIKKRLGNSIKAVYHLEAYQQLEENRQKYPCIVYQLRADTYASLELSGTSGHKDALYAVTVIDKASSVVRNVQSKLHTLTFEAYQDQRAVEYGAHGYKWLDVDVDEEGVELAVELEAKGYKFATLAFLLQYFHYEAKP
jgi:hypothetical protein